MRNPFSFVELSVHDTVALVLLDSTVVAWYTDAGSAHATFEGGASP
jgi:hypothetical protein